MTLSIWELDPTIITGTEVEVGQRVAAVHSLRNEQRLQQLQAERDALLAQRALLEAGGLPAEVEAAKARVAVARAEREAALIELARANALTAAGTDQRSRVRCPGQCGAGVSPGGREQPR